MFNSADYIILFILIVSMVYGFIRGFVRELFSFIVLLLAFWIALEFSDNIAVYLAYIIVHPILQFAAGFVVLFIGTLIIGAVIGWLLGKMIEKSGLSMWDHCLGLLFGFIRGIIIILVALFIAQLIYSTVPLWRSSSFLIPKIWYLMQSLQHILPHSMQQHIQVPLRG